MLCRLTTQCHPSRRPASSSCRGTLDLLILRTLLPGPNHGHAIAKHIQRTSEDLLKVETGSLYPALYRLEANDWITAYWEKSDKGKRAQVLPNHAARTEAAAQRRVQVERLRPRDGAAPQAARRGDAMTFFRKLSWWMQRRRREAELREELEFHIDEEADARQADGLPSDQARLAARRDLGNVTLLREETRTLWSWVLVEQFAQDVRFALRTMLKNRMFTALAALSLALGIGANTAIYSFMDAILLRSLPVSDPASLVVIKWRGKPVRGQTPDAGPNFVIRSINGSIYRDPSGFTAAIFPFPAFERLRRRLRQCCRTSLPTSPPDASTS